MVVKNQPTGKIMNALLAALTDLKRPGLLMRAARHGALDYNRSRDLKRIMKSDAVPGPIEALGDLIRLEERAEVARKNSDMGYSVSRHIDLLIALIAEATLVQRVVQG